MCSSQVFWWVAFMSKRLKQAIQSHTGTLYSIHVLAKNQNQPTELNREFSPKMPLIHVFIMPYDYACMMT